MKKILGVLITILCFSLLISQSALAKDNLIEYQDEEHIEGESVKVEGVLSPIELSPIEENNNNIIKPAVIIQIPTIYSASVITGSKPTKTKRFVRYLTGSWAKASSYTWSKTQSASATISSSVGLTAKQISSQLGFSHTVSTSYSVAITIPANKSKFSKLAFYTDFTKRYIKVNKTKGATLLSTKYAYHYAPTKDTYLQVVYQ